jgi:putative flavoprotein involved in K+ transport
MDGLGILRASRETRVGKDLMRTNPFTGKSLGLGRLRRQGIRLVGRLSQAEGKTVSFTGSEAAEVDAVIRATGYRDNGKWVTISEVKDASGGFMHEWGVSPTPDLTPWAAVGSGRVGRPCSPASAMTLPTRLARSPSDCPS